MRSALLFSAPLLPMALDTAWRILEPLECRCLRTACHGCLAPDAKVDEVFAKARMPPFREAAKEAAGRFLVRHCRRDNKRLFLRCAPRWGSKSPNCTSVEEPSSESWLVWIRPNVRRSTTTSGRPTCPPSRSFLDRESPARVLDGPSGCPIRGRFGRHGSRQDKTRSVYCIHNSGECITGVP